MGQRVSILCRLSAALSLALLEWILMLLLFIDAVYCFLVTRFARLCKLPAPCPFCSRLDHVLGNEKPCFYRDLICKTHKSEISSLAFCRLHQKLASAQSLCEDCGSSLAPEKKPYTDGNKHELMTDANMFNRNQGNDYVLHSPLTRICSCCAQHFIQRSVALFPRKIAGLEPAEAAILSKSYTDYDMSSQVSKSLEPKDIYHSNDHTSCKRYGELNLTSEPDVEIPCADDGKRSCSPPHETNNILEDLHEDTADERLVTPSLEAVEPSELNVENEPHVSESHDVSSLASPVADDHLHNGIGRDKMEVKDGSFKSQVSQDDPLVVIVESGSKDNGADAPVSQIPVISSGELSQIHNEVEACQMTREGTADPYMSALTSQDCHDAVLGDRIIKDNLEEAPESEITVTPSGELHPSAVTDDPSTTEPAPGNTSHLASEDRDLKGDNHDSQVSGNSQMVDEAEGSPKKSEATGDSCPHELTPQDRRSAASEDLMTEYYVEGADVSQAAIRSSGEIFQGGDAVEEYPMTSETTSQRRPSLSTQISLNEAYKLAISGKGSLPSPTMTDVILGKDSSSSVNEELRLLLSQLSAAWGLEAPWVDPGPSPRAYGHGDDLVVQNIARRISIERNASGLDSLDGSIISEIEGESTIDRLRRQMDLDRKSIHLLCKELEAERSASAVATSQALAKITRLQDEKAAMQMEASHYHRMMEEQAEYNSEALAIANELLAQRDQQIEELEAELECYGSQFEGGRPTEKQANSVGLKQEKTATTSFEEALEATPMSTKSLVNFEDERTYIVNCLTKLEQKLRLYSNNSTSIDLSTSDAKEDELSDEVPPMENDLLLSEECSREEPLFLAKEAQSSAMSEEVELSTVQEEISNLNKRLKILEGDRNFLEHSINSLRNGKEGLKFIQDIARSLRELRAIAIDGK